VVSYEQKPYFWKDPCPKCVEEKRVRKEGTKGRGGKERWMEEGCKGLR
jgi:hypothetical protein